MNKAQKMALITSCIQDFVQCALHEPDAFKETIAHLSLDINVDSIGGRKFLILLAKFRKFSDVIWIESEKARKKFLKNLTEDIYDFLLHKPNINKL